MSDNVVSFGKYKDQPIDQIAAQDPKYIEWLMQQPWFASKFENLYKVVINNFNTGISETPEHNAMQVKFLDENFTKSLGGIATGFTESRVNELTSNGRKQAVEFMRSFDPFISIDRPRHYLVTTFFNGEIRLNGQLITREDCDKLKDKFESEKHSKLAKEALEKVSSFLNGSSRDLYERMDQLICVEGLEFEKGSDVVFRFICEWPDGISYNHPEFKVRRSSGGGILAVECKPTIGDDFPGVLRQMLAQRKIVRCSHQVLLVGKYQGVGASVSQFIEMFKCNGIQVIFVADVESA